LSDVVNATGIVKPRDVALVFPRLPGIVEEIYAHVGQKVAKGDRLFKIDSEMAKRNLEKAQAAAEKTKKLENAAKTGWEKLKDINNRGYGSERDVLEAEAKHAGATEAVKEAESALRQAQLAMEWTTVKAPIAGTIIEKNLYIGQPVGLSAAAGGGGSSGVSAAALAAPGGSSSGPSTSSLFGMTEPKIPFMIAADLSDLEIYAQIPQGDIGRVKAGFPVKFTVDAFPDEAPFDGQVTEIHLMPINVLGTNFYPAVIKVTNRQIAKDSNAPKAAEEAENWILRPGMTMNVDITRETHNNVWMLPSAALSFTLDDFYIKPEAREKLAEKRKGVGNSSDWKTVWILRNNMAWPILARIGGKNEQGRGGINTGSYAEVLEWDDEMKELINKEKKIRPEDPKTYPKPIIAAPQPKQSIFDKPILKFS
jgi:multidrug efflux pump subunit AcrA (membrane-fusion protein)